MGAIAQLLDFFANGAHLFFGGLRLHDDEHNFTLGKISCGDSRRAIRRAKSSTS
jgi:hypothetical protein